MNYNSKIKLLFIPILIGGFLLFSLLKTNIRDTFFLRNRPWAYSSDKNAKLLVGTWEGAFKDPTGMDKTISLKIEKPVATNKSRRKFFSEIFKNKESFTGSAEISGKNGLEKYELSGKVKKEDMQQFSFKVIAINNLNVENFYIREAEKGNWQVDGMSFTTDFVFRRKDGSSHWSSSDPIHEYKTTISLKRKL